MVEALEKEENKNFMTPEKMDDLLSEARAQYDWIK